MKDNTESSVLAGKIASQKIVLDETVESLRSFVETDLPEIGRNWKSALVIAGLIENYYTATETVLFRVAQEFGNQLSADRWHADLLDRLTHEVKKIRPKVLENDTYKRLDELRRFRHFKRYYYETDYDWDKLDFLIKKMHEVHPMLLRDLDRFLKFLNELA